MKEKIQLLTFSVLAALLVPYSGAQDGAEPDRLKRLRESWTSARERALAPIDRTYLEELQKLLDTLTKSGRLDAALHVKKEIESLKATEVRSPHESSPNFRTWIREVTVRKTKNNALIQITKDEVELGENISPQITKVDPDNRLIEFTYGGGAVQAIQFDEALKTAVWKSIPEGKKIDDLVVVPTN